MAQPPAYNRAKDFTEDFGQETDHAALNAELDKASNSINDIRRNLAVLQADDGKLRPYVVTPDSISPDLNDALVEGVVAGAQEMLTRSLAAADASVASAEKARASELAAAASEKTASAGAGSASGFAERAKAYAEYANQNGIPAGTIVYFAATMPPAGYLKADGSAVGRETYPELFAAIGTTFGSGDGKTTFNLPDLRGEFVRGFDDGRGVDTGHAFGHNQNDSVENHQHLTTAGIEGSIVVTAGRPQNSTYYGLFGEIAQSLVSGIIKKIISPTQSETSTGSTWIAHDKTSGIVNYGTADTDALSLREAETRPRNIALLACIKAFDAATNPGLVNVTQLAQEMANKTNAAEAAHAAMPSSRYIALSVPVPSMPYRYTVPADGYIGFRGTPTKVGGSITINTSGQYGVMVMPPIVTVCQTILPVSKGMTVGIWVEHMTIEFAGFIYANGSL